LTVNKIANIIDAFIFINNSGYLSLVLLCLIVYCIKKSAIRSVMNIAGLFLVLSCLISIIANEFIVLMTWFINHNFEFMKSRYFSRYFVEIWLPLIGAILGQWFWLKRMRIKLWFSILIAVLLNATLVIFIIRKTIPAFRGNEF
jgi:hypothetical protein